METLIKELGPMPVLTVLILAQFIIFAWAALRESSRMRWLIADLPCRPVRWEE